MHILRRVRGVIGTALIWGVAWAGAAGIVWLVVSPWIKATSPSDTSLVAPPAWALMLFYGIVGAWAGAVFATVFALGDRSRTFAELTMRRVVTWGVLGALSYPLVIWLSAAAQGDPAPRGMVSGAAICGLLGGISAAAMLAVARRSSDRTPPEGSHRAPSALRNAADHALPDAETGPVLGAPPPNEALRLTSGLWKRAARAARRSARD